MKNKGKNIYIYVLISLLIFIMALVLLGNTQVAGIVLGQLFIVIGIIELKHNLIGLLFAIYGIYFLIWANMELVLEVLPIQLLILIGIWLFPFSIIFPTLVNWYEVRKFVKKGGKLIPTERTIDNNDIEIIKYTYNDKIYKSYNFNHAIKGNIDIYIDPQNPEKSCAITYKKEYKEHKIIFWGMVIFSIIVTLLLFCG